MSITSDTPAAETAYNVTVVSEKGDEIVLQVNAASPRAAELDVIEGGFTGPGSWIHDLRPADSPEAPRSLQPADPSLSVEARAAYWERISAGQSPDDALAVANAHQEELTAQERERAQQRETGDDARGWAACDE